MNSKTYSNWLPLTLSAVAMAALPSICAADDPAGNASEDAIVISKPEAPQRDVKFQEVEEPLELALFAADPALLEQKYVATVNLGVFSNVPEAAVTVYNATVMSIWQRARSNSLPVVVNMLTKSASPDKKPADDIMRLLRDPNYVLLNPPTNRNESRLSFRVIGKDTEQVTTLSLALIALYDNGLYYPVQQSLHDDMVGLQERIQKTRDELTIEQEKLEPMLRRVKSFEPISAETISNLKTQQRLTLVDMAAAKARIDACAKILQRNDVRGKPIAEEVESIKIAAEIELVGLAARREAVDQIVNQGTQYRDLQGELASLRRRVSSLNDTLTKFQSGLRFLDQQRRDWRPLPLLADAIKIQPIKWKSGSRESTFGTR